MKKAIFALFSICVIAFSCKKSDPDPVAPTDQPYNNSNSGTNWIYEVKTQDPTTGDTTTTYDTSHVGSPDTTVGSKIYKRVIHNDGTNTFFNVTGSDYFQFQNLLDTSLEVLYLKDNGAVGSNWVQTYDLDFGLGTPVPLTLTSTITEKGISKTVYGIIYNDVITVKTDVTSILLPGGIVSDIRNYYSRNIGLIEADYNIDISAATLSIHSQSLLKFSDPH